MARPARGPEDLDETTVAIGRALGPAARLLGWKASDLSPRPSIVSVLPVAVLRFDDTLDSTLEDVRDRNFFWHYQVHDSGQRPLTSIFTVSSAGKSTVIDLRGRRVASQFADAIVWLDQHDSTNDDAYLLNAPGHGLTAIWLDGPGRDEFVVVTDRAAPGRRPKHTFRDRGWIRTRLQDPRISHKDAEPEPDADSDD